jgi:hypothetical protein
MGRFSKLQNWLSLERVGGGRGRREPYEEEGGDERTRKKTK